MKKIISVITVITIILSVFVTFNIIRIDATDTDWGMQVRTIVSFEENTETLIDYNLLKPDSSFTGLHLNDYTCISNEKSYSGNKSIMINFKNGQSYSEVSIDNLNYNDMNLTDWNGAKYFQFWVNNVSSTEILLDVITIKQEGYNYKLKSTGTAELLAKGTTTWSSFALLSEKDNSNLGSVWIPSEFEGFIRIPISDFEDGGYKFNTNIPASGFSLWYYMASGENSTIYMDDISIVGDELSQDFDAKSNTVSENTYYSALNIGVDTYDESLTVKKLITFEEGFDTLKKYNMLNPDGSFYGLHKNDETEISNITKNSGEKSVRIRFKNGESYSGVSIDQIDPSNKELTDWNSGKYIQFWAHNISTTPILLDVITLKQSGYNYRMKSTAHVEMMAGGTAIWKSFAVLPEKDDSNYSAVSIPAGFEGLIRVALSDFVDGSKVYDTTIAATGLSFWFYMASGKNSTLFMDDISLVCQELAYKPMGNGFVSDNGSGIYNRPLYGDSVNTIVWAGDKPLVTAQFIDGVGQGIDRNSLGKLRIGLIRAGKSKWIDEFSGITSIYYPGRYKWMLKDVNFPGLSLICELVTLPSGGGYVLKINATGAVNDDKLVWSYGGMPSSYTHTLSGTGFNITNSTQIIRQVKGKFPDGATLKLANFDVLKNPLLFSQSSQNNASPAVCAVDTLTNNSSKIFTVTNQAVYSSGGSAVNQSALDNPSLAFSNGVKRVNNISKKITVNTPSQYLNTAVAASCIALDGEYVSPNFLHSGTTWRTYYLGWRTMYGSTAYGWHDRVLNQIAAVLPTQIKSSNKTTASTSGNLTMQDSNSRFFGTGWISNGQGNTYDMQSQFFDQAINEWRATGNQALAGDLLPALKLHIDWATDCFDPDGDGLFESYVNSWPTDSVWYNGGGTVEESVYIYNACKAVADMCKNAGDINGVNKYTAYAEKIKNSLMNNLWLSDKGYFGAYKEQGGYNRVHSDAWLYSEFLPVQNGISNKIESLASLFYTEWGLERTKLPYGGQLCNTSNWTPGVWSVREQYGGDNYDLATAYFTTGLGDMGWQLLKGNLMEECFGDTAAKAAYKNKTNFLCPGGFSFYETGIDFTDIASVFCKSVVNGMFGYNPDYPNNKVVISPALPSEWDNASMSSADYSFSYKQNNLTDIYEIKTAKSSNMEFKLPVKASSIKKVKVNGTTVDFSTEAGFGNSIIKFTVLGVSNVKVEIELTSRKLQQEETIETINVGDNFEMSSKDGKIIEITDLNNCLENITINNGLANASVKSAGNHPIVAKVQSGNLEYYKVHKLFVKDIENESFLAEKTPALAKENATWDLIDLSGIYNGDIKTIFQQEYLTPRPNTCSVRIGKNGYEAWPFKYWGSSLPPAINLNKLNSLTNSDGNIKTLQNAIFKKFTESSNIAFTSLWDNWPNSVTVPINKKGESIWLMVAGSTNPMQTRIANAELVFTYSDGEIEKLPLIPPLNFWSLTPFSGYDYDYNRDKFVLPESSPKQVQLGDNCRAMILSWKLRENAELTNVSLNCLSQEVVIGLMGVSIMNPIAQSPNNTSNYFNNVVNESANTILKVPNQINIIGDKAEVSSTPIIRGTLQANNQLIGKKHELLNSPVAKNKKNTNHAFLSNLLLFSAIALGSIGFFAFKKIKMK